MYLSYHATIVFEDSSGMLRRHLYKDDRFAMLKVFVGSSKECLALLHLFSYIISRLTIVSWEAKKKKQ